MKNRIFFLLIFFLLVGCNNDKKTDKNNETQSVTISVRDTAKPEDVKTQKTEELKNENKDTGESVSTVKVKPEPKKDTTQETKVIAYYFYTNYRCQSCYTIEKYTKEAIEGNFDDELASGVLVFKPVNVEEKENEHFLGDYQLYTKSVVLSLIKDGKEIKFKNLKKIWELLRNKDEFYKYIEEETKGFLNEINQEKEL